MSKQWPKVKIGDVVRQEREPVGSFDGDGLPVLGVTNVAGVTHTGVEASDDLGKYLRVRPGRFVFNPYRINVGSVGLSSETQDGICSPAYVVFAPTERIDANFILYFLKSARGNQLINFHGNRGSVRSALRFDDLAGIEIPLPSLAEQRQVVARIEELAEQIHDARRLRHKAAEEAWSLVEAASRQKFGGPQLEVGEIAYVTKLAGFEYTKFLAGAPPGEVVLLRAGNVRNHGLDLSNAATIPMYISNQLPRSKLSVNDVCYSACKIDPHLRGIGVEN